MAQQVLSSDSQCLMNLIGVGIVQSEVNFFDVDGHVVVVVGLHIDSPRVSVAVLLPLLTKVTRLGTKRIWWSKMKANGDSPRE